MTMGKFFFVAKGSRIVLKNQAYRYAYAFFIGTSVSGICMNMHIRKRNAGVPGKRSILQQDFCQRVWYFRKKSCRRKGQGISDSV